MQYDNDIVRYTIRRLRKQRKLSQEALSGLAGIGRTHLTMIESGRKQANFETIWKIAIAMNMQPSDYVKQIEFEIEKDKSHN